MYIYIQTLPFYDIISIKVKMLEYIRHLKKVNYSKHYRKLRILNFKAKNTDSCAATTHITSANTSYA